MPLLVCHDLTLGYEGKAVIKNLSFEVRAGNYVCIVGENGSGKTTLMRALLHLLSPQSGEIRFSDGLTAHDIGYLPQRTEAQKDFPASVREVVLSGFAGKSRSPFLSREQRSSAGQIMERLGIAPLASRSFRTLSGGQQQRTLLARALCATGKLLLLDEPMASLDPTAAHELYHTIEELNRRDGITVVMITHDVHTASHYATHILDIGSTPHFFGTVAEYRAIGRLCGCGEEAENDA